MAKKYLGVTIRSSTIQNVDLCACSFCYCLDTNNKMYFYVEICRYANYNTITSELFVSQISY